MNSSANEHRRTFKELLNRGKLQIKLVKNGIRLAGDLEVRRHTLFDSEIVPGRRLESRVSDGEPLFFDYPARSLKLFTRASACSHTGAIFLGDRLFLPSLFDAGRALATLHSQSIVGGDPYDLGDRCAVVIDSNVWNNYYHWLVDILPRLFSGLADHSGLPTVPVLVFSRSLPPTQCETLNRVVQGRFEVIQLDRPRRIRAAQIGFLPFFSSRECGWLPPPVLDWMRPLLMNSLIAPTLLAPDRIYISRAGAEIRKYLNEVEIQKMMAELGFATLQLEAMTFDEQVHAFSNASVIFGRHGAGLTNLLFSRDARVLEHQTGTPHAHYRWLAAATHNPYFSIVESGQKNDDLVADIDAVRHRLITLPLE